MESSKSEQGVVTLTRDLLISASLTKFKATHLDHKTWSNGDTMHKVPIKDYSPSAEMFTYSNVVRLKYTISKGGHPAGRSVTSDWSVNIFIIVVYENCIFKGLVRIFCPKHD